MYIFLSELFYGLGTFCAIDLILDNIIYCQSHSLTCEISVFNVVHFLRDCRPGMVQSKQQYQFITTFIAHCIKCKLMGIK